MILMLSLILAADIGVITERDGIAIHRCHDEDKALIEVVHVTAKTNFTHGYFETGKPTLFLSDLSMIPTGTNLFRVRTVCSGSTSEVSEVKFVIRRPVPKPTVRRTDRNAVMPPLPSGMSLPIPDATNYASYQEWTRRASEGRRRSQ